MATVTQSSEAGVAPRTTTGAESVECGEARRHKGGRSYDSLSRN